MNMPSPQTILLLSAASAWFMTGLIWFVQIVHYPQFSDVPGDCFGTYHRRHTRLTTWVVALPMLLEMITAVWLIFQAPTGTPPWILWSSMGLVGITTLSTAALQVPAHNRLSTAFSQDVHRRLCSTNWLRTIAWSMRAVLMMWAIRLLLH